MKPPSSAFYDFYYLLARSYPRNQALELVSARYHLTKRESILLSRCIHAPSTNAEIKEKKQDPKSIRDNCLVIDGFNQLTTIYAALINEPLYLCSDTMLRDALLAGPRLVIENISILAKLLDKALKELSPRRTIVVLDSQPSHSGEAAAYLRKTLGVEAKASPTADKEIIQLSIQENCVSATSDIAITLRVPRIFDLAYYTITNIVQGSARINNIPHLLKIEHQWWCQSQAGP